MRRIAVALFACVLVAGCGRDRTTVAPDPAASASCAPCPTCNASSSVATTPVDLSAPPKPEPADPTDPFALSHAKDPFAAATKESVTVALDASGDTFVDGAKVADADLERIVKTKIAAGAEHFVIAADPSVPYGKVIHVIDELKIAGATKIAFSVAHP
jgi:biopolymer transport protein ExbD